MKCGIHGASILYISEFDDYENWLLTRLNGVPEGPKNSDLRNAEALWMRKLACAIVPTMLEIAAVSG